MKLVSQATTGFRSMGIRRGGCGGWILANIQLVRYVHSDTRVIFRGWNQILDYTMGYSTSLGVLILEIIYSALGLIMFWAWRDSSYQISAGRDT